MVGFRSPLSEDQRRELQQVYRSNVSSVYAFFSYSVDATTAEDLTAATFERVVRSWRRFDASRVDTDVLRLVKAAAVVERNGVDYAAYLNNVFTDDPDFQHASDNWAV